MQRKGRILYLTDAKGCLIINKCLNPNIKFINITETFICLLDGDELGCYLRGWPGCSLLEAEEKEFNKKIINLLKIWKGRLAVKVKKVHPKGRGHSGMLKSLHFYLRLVWACCEHLWWAISHARVWHICERGLAKPLEEFQLSSASSSMARKETKENSKCLESGLNF